MKKYKYPHLYIRNNKFYFRYRFSNRARITLHRQEICRSLKTDNVDKAAKKCLRLHRNAKSLEKLVGKMTKKKKLTKDRADVLVQLYFREEYDQQEVMLGMEIESQNPDGGYSFNIDEEAETLKQYAKEIITANFSNQTKSDALKLLDEKEIERPRPNNLQSHYFRGIARANQELYRIAVATLKCNLYDRAIKDPLFFEDNSDLDGGLLAPFFHYEREYLYLSEMVEEFVKEKKPDWKYKTLVENQKIFEMMVDLLDDKPIGKITRDDMKNLRDLICKIPTNMVKYKKFDDLSLIEAIKLDNGETPITAKTAKKKWSCAKALITWIINEKDINDKLVNDITIKDKSDPKQKRFPFSSEELVSWFNCPIYTGSKSAKARTVPGPKIYKNAFYWVPLIALYTGMRLAEIIQLEICDVRQEEGIWIFDINLNSDNGIVKSIKNNRPRKVPIHSELIRLGFLDFYETRQKANYIRVFDEIKRSKNESITKGNYSDLYGKKFIEDLERLGIKKEGLVFHSFRHGVVDALQIANASEVYKRYIVGHAQEGQNKTYGSYPLKQIKECVDMIAYDVNLDHLIENKN